EEVGKDQSKEIPRFQEEVDDVLAAIDYLRTVPSADTKRLGIMGWSFGGIVTMLTTSRSSAFAVAVDQAGASLSWDGSASIRNAMIKAAGQSTTPSLFMDAKNDRSILSVTTLSEIFRNRGIPQQLIIYEPFTPAPGTRIAAPGHAIFSAQGIGLWEH